MNISECYKAMGGNYEEVLGRLRSERLIVKFLKNFQGRSKLCGSGSETS